MAKPAYVSEHPYYAPEFNQPAPLVTSPFYEPVGELQPIYWASESDVPSMSSASLGAGNPPSKGSENYNPFFPPGFPKSWLKGIDRQSKFRIARAKALGYYPSQQQEEEKGEGEGEGEGEREGQLTKKPCLSREPRISVHHFHHLTKEERKMHTKMVIESDGFDCPYVPPENAVPFLLTPVPEEGLKGLEDMADLALKPYNDQNGTSYQLVKVIKATSTCDGGMNYKITLQAKDDATGSSPRNFQAYVTQFVDNTTKVHFCRVEQVSKPPGGSEERHRSRL